jgi:acetyl-CoA carboxylase biotin carboxyl carrier protein
VDIKDIKSIIDLMTKNGLTEFEMQKDNEKIRIKRGFDGEPVLMSAPSYSNGGNQPPTPPQVPTAPTATAPAAPDNAGTKDIKSPMVGTFYRTPSPEAASYIEIGSKVTEDTVVCIIEAMKVMNEIKAEVRGTITEILLENGKPVEFGKPLFRVKLA